MLYTQRSVVVFVFLEPFRHREASPVHRGGTDHEGGERPIAEETPA